MKFLPVFFLAFLLMLASCATAPKNESVSVNDSKIVSEKDMSEVSVLEGNWELVSFEKDDEFIPIVPDTAPNVIGINFSAPTDEVYPINGFLGVNLFFDSSAVIKNNRENKDDNKKFIGKGFSIENLTTTLRTGPDEHMAFEELFKECLLKSNKLSVKNYNSLIIFNDEQNIILTFTRK